MRTISLQISLQTNTAGEEIFNILDGILFLNEMPYENCADIFTDGAKAKMGHNIKAVVKIKYKAKH